MPELRQNPATKEWVIIATERAKRPEELGTGVINPPANEKEHCPFCPGNEKHDAGGTLLLPHLRHGGQHARLVDPRHPQHVRRADAAGNPTARRSKTFTST